MYLLQTVHIPDNLGKTESSRFKFPCILRPDHYCINKVYKLSCSERNAQFRSKCHGTFWGDWGKEKNRPPDPPSSRITEPLGGCYTLCNSLRNGGRGGGGYKGALYKNTERQFWVRGGGRSLLCAWSISWRGKVSTIQIFLLQNASSPPVVYYDMLKKYDKGYGVWTVIETFSAAINARYC